MENIKIRGKQNKLFPEGPVTLYIKWFAILLETLKLEIH